MYMEERLLNDNPIEIFNRLLGGKWKMHIFQELMSGPKRFGELKRSLGNITQKVLTDSLRQMEEDGLVVRKVFAETTLRVEYSLAPKAYGLSNCVRTIISNVYSFSSSRYSPETETSEKTTFYSANSRIPLAKDYQARIKKAKEAIQEAEVIVIGTGSGINSASGIDFFSKKLSKKWFHDFQENTNFLTIDELIDKYSELRPDNINEYWFFWATLIKNACFDRQPTEAHLDLYKLIGEKSWLAITTNSDMQLEKSGFASQQIYSPLGTYRYLQCRFPCTHNACYQSYDLINDIFMKIDSGIKLTETNIPKCRRCGDFLVPNHFRTKTVSVAEPETYLTRDQFQKKISSMKNKRIVFLEIGCGFRLPNIIRYPFETYVESFDDARLIRINSIYPNITNKKIAGKAYIFGEDIIQTLNDLL